MALRLFEVTAALRDFDPAYARFGSDSVIRRCPAQCPVCPKADIGRLSPRYNSGDCRHSRNGPYGISTVDQPQSALMLRARITLPHFSVSSAMSLPKSAGEPASTVPPRSARWAFMLGSSRAALISLLSL